MLDIRNCGISDHELYGIMIIHCCLACLLCSYRNLNINMYVVIENDSKCDA